MPDAASQIAARALLTQTIAHELRTALLGIQLPEQADHLHDLASQGLLTEATAYATSQIARARLTRGLRGQNESDTYRLFHTSQMAATLQTAADLIDTDPLASIRLTASTWPLLPSITPPGWTASRPRHFLNRYQVHNDFTGTPLNSWYHQRLIFTGTVASTQTLTAARELAKLLNTQPQSEHHEKSKEPQVHPALPVFRIHTERAPGQSRPAAPPTDP